MSNTNTVQIKHSVTPNAVPTAAQLLQAELAITLPNKKLYTKDHLGNVIEPVPTLADNATNATNATNAANADTVTNGVYTTGDQTIAGVKTFSSSPVVPDATTPGQAVNKGQVDLVSSIGVGQTWQNVTSSRALGVTYTNTTGRPIFINIISTSSSFNLVNITIDGLNMGYNSFNGGAAQSSNRNIVPAGSTYVVTMSGAGISQWNELR